MNTKNTQRRLGTHTLIGIALALGALVVPAHGMVIHDASNPANPAATQRVVTPPDRIPSEGTRSWSGRTTYQPVSPQPSTPAEPIGFDRAVREGSATAFVADRSIREGSGTPAVATPQPETTSSDFDWTDAGIGFGAAAGLVLLAGGSLVASRRFRGSSRAAF